LNVFDSSALLAFVLDEPGADTVERELGEGGVCGAVNWSEIAQRILTHGRNWELTSALLRSYGLAVEPVVEADAEWAALRWRRGEGLTLADRLCLAIGSRLEATVWTADAAWGDGDTIRQIR
jgi:ribonuclease VapC